MKRHEVCYGLTVFVSYFLDIICHTLGAFMFWLIRIQKMYRNKARFRRHTSHVLFQMIRWLVRRLNQFGTANLNWVRQTFKVRQSLPYNTTLARPGFIRSASHLPNRIHQLLKCILIHNLSHNSVRYSTAHVECNAMKGSSWRRGK